MIAFYRRWPARGASCVNGCKVAAAVAQSSSPNLPVVLALLLMVRHYLWDKVPYELQGSVWKLCSAVCILGLLAYLYVPRWWPVFGVFAFEESQVVICSAWYIADPWPVPDGMGVCSAKSGIDLGALGVTFVAFALLRATRYKV